MRPCIFHSVSKRWTHFDLNGEFSIGLTCDCYRDGGAVGLEGVPDEATDLTLPITLILGFYPGDQDATALPGDLRGYMVPESARLGKDPLAEGVDVSVGCLPQAQDGLGGGWTCQAGIRTQDSRNFVGERGCLQASRCQLNEVSLKVRWGAFRPGLWRSNGLGTGMPYSVSLGVL